jgi:hypothetical protein
MFNNFYQKSCLFEMWKMVEPDRTHMTIRRMRIACWITMATNTHLEYVILFYFYNNNDWANAPQCYVIPIVTGQGP